MKGQHEAVNPIPSFPSAAVSSCVFSPAGGSLPAVLLAGGSGPASRATPALAGALLQCCGGAHPAPDPGAGNDGASRARAKAGKPHQSLPALLAGGTGCVHPVLGPLPPPTYGGGLHPYCFLLLALLHGLRAGHVLTIFLSQLPPVPALLGPCGGCCTMARPCFHPGGAGSAPGVIMGSRCFSAGFFLALVGPASQESPFDRQSATPGQWWPEAEAASMAGAGLPHGHSVLPLWSYVL